ncbi:MAG: hypothetical protein PHV30_05490 [Candidatus Margulisbacteria bacterium]|nr:hypothetical protein [Candidatus Margulisiibacteriota bacterium]
MATTISTQPLHKTNFATATVAKSDIQKNIDIQKNLAMFGLLQLSENTKGKGQWDGNLASAFGRMAINIYARQSGTTKENFAESLKTDCFLVSGLSGQEAKDFSFLKGIMLKLMNYRELTPSEKTTIKDTWQKYNIYKDPDSKLRTDDVQKVMLTVIHKKSKPVLPGKSVEHKPLFDIQKKTAELYALMSTNRFEAKTGLKGDAEDVEVARINKTYTAHELRELSKIREELITLKNVVHELTRAPESISMQRLEPGSPSYYLGKFDQKYGRNHEIVKRRIASLIAAAYGDLNQKKNVSLAEVAFYLNKPGLRDKDILRVFIKQIESVLETNKVFFNKYINKENNHSKYAAILLDQSGKNYYFGVDRLAFKANSKNAAVIRNINREALMDNVREYVPNERVYLGKKHYVCADFAKAANGNPAANYTENVDGKLKAVINKLEDNMPGVIIGANSMFPSGSKHVGVLLQKRDGSPIVFHFWGGAGMHNNWRGIVSANEPGKFAVNGDVRLKARIEDQIGLERIASGTTNRDVMIASSRTYRRHK